MASETSSFLFNSASTYVAGQINRHNLNLGIGNALEPEYDFGTNYDGTNDGYVAKLDAVGQWKFLRVASSENHFWLTNLF